MTPTRPQLPVPTTTSRTCRSPRAGIPTQPKDIDAFIVALPEKIFYPADAFDKLIPRLFKLSSVVTLPPQNDAVIRYFVTTGSAIRRFVREHESEYDPQLLHAVMKLPFAQFIWVVEFSTRAQWVNNQVSARAVIDATASLTEPYPFWLFHSLGQALVFGRESVRPDPKTAMGVLSMAATGLTGLTRMDTNLRPTQTK
jgi:hypothetical protein